MASTMALPFILWCLVFWMWIYFCAIPKDRLQFSVVSWCLQWPFSGDRLSLLGSESGLKRFCFPIPHLKSVCVVQLSCFWFLIGFAPLIREDARYRPNNMDILSVCNCGFLSGSSEGDRWRNDRGVNILYFITSALMDLWMGGTHEKGSIRPDAIPLFQGLRWSS